MLCVRFLIIFGFHLFLQPLAAASFGSGFIISDSGHIITCEHCIPKGSFISVLTEDGYSHEAEVLFRNAELDLACLKINSQTKNFFPIGDSTTAKILDSIYVFGFPLPSAIGSELSASTGTLNAIRNRGGLSLLQIDAPVNPGNSGGPILDSSGAIIGVAVSKLDPIKAIKRLGTIPERINFAVPSSVLRGELKRRSISFKSPSKKMDFEELRTLASSATIQIITTAPESLERDVKPLKRQSNRLELANIGQAASKYVLLGNNPDLLSELSIYAPKVDYFNRGQRDLAFIKSDLEALRKRWPERYYVISSVDQIGANEDGTIGTATVHFRFALFNGDKFFKGDADAFLVFDLSQKEPKLILVREHKTRKEKD